MTPLVRVSCSLLLLCALLKICKANCNSTDCTTPVTNTPNTTHVEKAVTKPKQVTIKTVNPSTTSIYLTWSLPEGQSDLYRVWWTDGNETKNISTPETSKNITGLTPGVNYTLSVAAVANDNKTEGDKAHVSAYTKPNVVGDLAAIKATTSSVFVSWTEPEGERSFFRVQWTNGSLYNSVNVTQTHFNLTNLTAGGQYEVTVTAVAGDGYTEGHNSSVSKYTHPEVVGSLTAVQVTTGSISLSWTEPEGERSFFRVQWTNGTANWNMNVTETKINITKLTAGVQYKVTVTAVAGDNTTESEVAELSKYTKPDVVRNLAAIKATTSSVFVSWTEPEGERSFFRVQWTNGSLYNSVNVTQTHFNLANLTAGGQYEVTVTAVAGDGYTEGHNSSVSKYTHPEVVGSLTAVQVTTESISLSWTEPEGERSFFRVQWTNGPTNWNMNVTETKINITKLTAGVQYNVTVTAVAGDNTTESEVAEVSKYTKPDVVRNLAAIKATTSSVFVSWTEPEGERSFFRVQWTNGSLYNSVNVTQTHFNLANLTAGGQYEVTVTAVAGDGYTEGHNSSVSKYTHPEVVGSLTAVQVTTKSISLSWTEPEGERSFFRVQWTNGTANWNMNVTETKINITKLTAGVQYNVTVTAVAGDNTTESEVAEVSKYTKPGQVGINHVSATTSSVSLVWSVPPGEVSGYRVDWHNGGAVQTNHTMTLSAVIDGLIPGTAYIISVFAVNGENVTGAPFSITSVTKPAVVQNLNIIKVTASTISLAWNVPEGNATSYIVEWNGRNDSTNETNFIISGLTPGDRYNITVAAVAGDSSKRGEKKLKTTFTRPVKPENVTLVLNETDKLNISWTLPEGRADKYEVSIRNEELNDFQNKTATHTNLVLTDLRPGRFFIIEVKAVVGEFSETSDQVSFATVPTPPGPISLTSRTNSSLSLEWPTPEWMDGAPNITYRVTYVKSGKDPKSLDVSVNNTELTPLLSGTRYNITVKTVGPNDLSSTAVQYSTFTRPNPVLNLEASPHSNTSVNVRWSLPLGFQDHYEFLVHIYDSTVAQVNKTRSNSSVLYDLEPGTRYNISVRTVAAPESESEEEFTFSYTVPNPVEGLTVKKVSTTTVQLSWRKQTDHKPSYSYQVEALEGAAVVHSNTTEKETYTVSELCAGTFYTFKVITVVEQVQSSVESTSTHTVPAAVSGVSVTGRTSSLSVSWTVANCRVDSYAVLLHRGGKMVQNATDLSNSTVNKVFEQLVAGVEYCVLVISYSGLRQNESEACNATFPNPPGAIMVDSQTVESINFTWSLPANMDHGQFNFSVSTPNDSYPTDKNWFQLEKLQSGIQYMISVVTVGARKYESTAVTTKNYTRPYPVTLLPGKTNITTDSVTLVWQQQEKKSDYSYVVEVSNNTLPATVTETTKTINGLLSGSNYSFTITTQTADGTRAEPVTVSYFTRPLAVQELKADTINTTAVRLLWKDPLQYKLEYTYRVHTKDCDSHSNKTHSENTALIPELTPGTECSFCVVVRAADLIEGEEECIRQYTKPNIVQPSISSQGSNNSILVSWTKPSGNVEHFKVILTGPSDSHMEPEWKSGNTSSRFWGLSAGRLYNATVISCSGPFNESSATVSNATFPNPPGPIKILKQTTGSISIKWEEAPQMSGASFDYKLSNISAGGGNYIKTPNTSHSFTSLPSGTSYSVSVSTVGLMGFQSDTVQVIMVTTRPFAVKHIKSSAEEERIRLSWEHPDQHKESYRYLLTRNSYDGFSENKTADKEFIFDKLEPGNHYNLSVTTETSDGTTGDLMWRDICTKASSVLNITCTGPNKSNAELVLSWLCPKGRYSGFSITVNHTDSIIQTSSKCSHTVPNLRHHTQYHLAVETLSCGRSSDPVNLPCLTGITDPPVPEDFISQVKVADTEYYKFTVQVGHGLLNSTHGPITHVGVLLTQKTLDASDFRNYLGKTYNEWKKGDTSAYLATVAENNPQSRSAASYMSLVVGDESGWAGYTNGALDAKGSYHFAVVLFTSLIWKEDLIDGSESLVSMTTFSKILILPENPVVIGLAVGLTLGIFCILFLILIGFIIYWKRLSKKESPDIQIHSMRAKSVAVSIEDFEAYYRKQKADSNCGFAEEFEDLKAVGIGQTKMHALNVENKPKNRYNNVLPYDSSRVKLSIIHGSPYDDYINANYMPGYNSRKEFIAAQGPLPHTVKDFWRMIWEKNVQTLVMLTRCNEQGRVKCEQYWDHGTKHYENIIVTTTSEIPLKDWTIRDFNIKNVKTAETRSVRHFHFTAWPDHGVPETTELLISFRHLVREHMDQYSPHSPTVVHCSAGVGRTGTFIAIDHLIIQIERENTVDVFGIVHDLRINRSLMVQTEDQYVFLNQCAMDIIRSRTGNNVDLIYQNTAALSIYENVEPKYRNGYNNA